MGNTYGMTMEYWLIYVVILTGVVNIDCLDTMSISMHSTGRLPCPHNVSSNEFHRVKWYQSRRDNVFEYSDLAVVSWDNTSRPILAYNYGIDKDFSLVIYNVSIPDEGLYRCHITLNVTVQPFSRSYDVKLNVYALPSKPPFIQEVNDTFNCSVDRVYPLLYPHVEFKHEKYAVQNQDGTYNTSVSGSIQDIPSESKVVSCSFLHFNYSQVSSLILYPTTTPYGDDEEQYHTTHPGSISPEVIDQQGKGLTHLKWPILALAGIVVVCLITGIGLLLWTKYKEKFHAPVPTVAKSTLSERMK